ncbi:MAG: LamG domain-containing protein [Candidatus Aenigmarchaeota archaeon]|nr:LamG domain-containing protein [Candidatus Aenigmarchaeota archaeon]
MLLVTILFSIPVFATHNPSVSHSADGVTNGTFQDNYTFISSGQNRTPIVIRANDTQLANLTVWQTFGGVPLASINATGSWRLGGAATPVLFIDNNTGRVGIRTSSPQYNLEIAGSGLAISNGNALIWRNSVGTYRTVLLIDSDNLTKIGGEGGIVMYFSGSNVGIGTASPSTKLDVMGNASFNDSVTITNGTLWQPVYPSDDGLVLYLPFSEGTGTTAYDRSPYGNDGTLKNSSTTCAGQDNQCPAWVAGKYGNALSVDGVNDLVNISDSNSLDLTTSFSIIFWINVKSNIQGMADRILDKSDYYIDLVNEASNEIRIVIGGIAVAASRTSLSAGRWYHVAFTANGTNMSVFVDGVLENFTTFTAPAANALPLYIGTRSADTGHYGNHTIDEVRIYNRSLSVDEIRTQYLGGLQSNGIVVADKFRIVNTTASELVRVTNSGSVGIGTTAPTAPLHIINSASTQFIINDSAGGGQAQILLSPGTGGAGTLLTAGVSTFAIRNETGSPTIAHFDMVSLYAGINTRAPNATLHVLGTGTGGGLRVTNQSNGAEVFFVNSTLGRVGVGITTPLAKLQVNSGAIYANSGTTDTVFNGGTINDGAELIGSSGYWGIRQSTDNSFNLDVYNSGSPIAALTVKNSGSVGIRAITPNATLHILGTGTGGGLRVTNQSNAAEVFFVNSTLGSVGIGTTSPTSLLHVNGIGALLNISNNTETHLFVNGTTGNVGIGTISSGAKLEVSYDESNTTVLELSRALVPTQSLRIIDAGGSVWEINAAESAFHLLFTAGTDRELRFKTGATQKMVIDKDGNVGIGTATPISLAHIASTGTNATLTISDTAGHSNSSIDLLETITGGNYGGRIRYSENENALHLGVLRLGTETDVITITRDTQLVGINNTAPNATLHIVGSGTGGGLRVTNQSNAAEVFFVNSTLGMVGIGTTSPASTLSVVGNFSVTGNANSSIDGSTLFIDAANNRIGIGTIPIANKLEVGGAVFINGSYTNPGGLVDAMILSWEGGDGGYGLIQAAEYGNVLRTIRFDALTYEIRVGGPTNAINIDSVGKVGIGTTTPANTLVVNGTGATGGFRVTNQSNAAEVFFVNSTLGAVGIGTTSPRQTLTVVGDANVTGSLYAGSQSFKSIDTTGSIFQPVYPSDDGLLLYLPFSEGSGEITYDRSPYGNDGTVIAGASGPATIAGMWTRGKYGNALNVDGIDDYVEVPDSASLNASVANVQNFTNITLMAWVYVKRNGTHPSGEYIVAKGVNNAPGGGYSLQFDWLQNYSLFTVFTNESGTVTITSAANSVPWNRWTHLAGTYNGSNASVYVNGIFADSAAGTGTINTSANPLRVGVRSDYPNVPFNGTIDEVRVYSRALSVDEVRTQYLGGLQSHGSIVADKFRVVNTTNSTNFYVSPSGQVGIGTASPVTKLTVMYDVDTSSVWYSNGVAGLLVQNNNAAGDAVLKLAGTTWVGRIVYGGDNNADALIFSSRQAAGDTTKAIKFDNSGRVGIGATSPNATLHVLGTGTGGGLRVTNQSNGAEVFFVNSTLGMVGIGTTSPTNKLTVGGGIEITGTAAFAGTGDGFYHIGNNGIGIVTLGEPRITVLTGGNVGIGTTVPANTLVVNGTGATGGFRVTNQSNSYEAFFVNSTLGSVGIGTTTPRQKLDIAGSLNFTGSATISTTAGGLTLNPTGSFVLLRGWTTWSTGTAAFPGILITDDAGASAEGAYGASIGLSKPGENGGRRHAAIVARQDTASANQIGISFFTHPSTDATVAISEAMRMTYDGDLDMLTHNITNVGLVGIGTSAPVGTLDVRGNLTVNQSADRVVLRVVGPAGGMVSNLTEWYNDTRSSKVVAYINGTGDIFGQSKNFEITHPLDPSRTLVHSSLEGPEQGIYYRGEAELVDGSATVVLPSYFDALALKGNRTVQLTAKDGWSPLYVDGNVNGQFTVKTTPDGNK